MNGNTLCKAAAFSNNSIVLDHKRYEYILVFASSEALHSEIDLATAEQMEHIEIIGDGYDPVPGLFSYGWLTDEAIARDKDLEKWCKDHPDWREQRHKELLSQYGDRINPK